MIAVRVDDLAFYAGEAIARPVTAELGATTPLLRRLEVAAGEALGTQLQVHEPLALGAAVVTGAGALSVELLIHAVVCTRTEPVTRAGVRRAVLSALQRAHDFDIHHLALPPFGLGAGNLDVEDSADVMLEAIAEHWARVGHATTITIIVETDQEAEAFTRRLPRAAA